MEFAETFPRKRQHPMHFDHASLDKVKETREANWHRRSLRNTRQLNLVLTKHEMRKCLASCGPISFVGRGSRDCASIVPCILVLIATAPVNLFQSQQAINASSKIKKPPTDHVSRVRRPGTGPPFRLGQERESVEV